MAEQARRRRRDAGSGPVTVIMVLAVLALCAVIGVTARFAAAGDERSSAQHAADAAALAGAQAILDDLPDKLSPGFLVPSDIATLIGGGVCVPTGSIEASTLAAQNGATVTSYCYNVFADEVSVSVRMNASSDGPPARAEAVAATTFDASSCSLADDFEAPTPPPSPPPADDEDDDDPPPPPPPPSSVDTFLDCGFGALSVVFRPLTARFGFASLAAELADVRPRLVR